MLGTFVYDDSNPKFYEHDLFYIDFHDDELFDRLPISITSADGTQINTSLHIKFAPDKTYPYQHIFHDLNLSNAWRSSSAP